MLWPAKRVEEIGEEDIRQLIAGRQIELQTIEYKGDFPGPRPSDRKEFLADMSSFANARGGHIFYGIPSDAEGVPKEPIGLANRSVDADKQQLENMIRDGIRPAIPGLGLHGVELEDGGVVYVIRVPQSLARPHQVVFQRDHRFYSRASAGKFRLDVDSLRPLFEFSADIAERLRLFRQERLGAILAGGTPVPLLEQAPLVLHIVPLTSLERRAVIDPNLFKAHRHNKPIRFDSTDWRFNFDGYATWTWNEQYGRAHGYFQGFRSGAIEAVDVSTLSAGSKIPSTSVEVLVIHATFRYLDLLRSIEVEPTILVLLSMHRIRGRTLAVKDQLRYSTVGLLRGEHPFDRDDLLFDEIMLENYPESIEQVATAIRPVFDSMWQAAGWERCFDYDDDGSFQNLRQLMRQIGIR